MARKLLISYMLLSSVLFRISGQYYSTGQSPFSFRWHRLKTAHFSFIFPASYDSQIMRTATIFENAWELVGGKYGETELKNIPIIIHNHSIESNGYVAWAPSRVELYPLPDQDNIPLGHIGQLALHELTHAAQMKGLTTGISRPLSYIFGEQYTGALGIYIPFWFLEGDAVVSETIHTNSGRGRTPSFEKYLKALLVEKNGIYSYDKMINGSFRNFTPDHYRFGYQMAAWTMKEFGQDIWSYPIEFTARNPYSINPFNFSLKDKTGLRKRDIYLQTMRYLRDNWLNDIGNMTSHTPAILNPDKGYDYINYYSPLPAGRDSIIAIRTSLFDIPRFVIINTAGATEKILFTPGYVWPFRLSFSNGIIVWAEERNDPRWENRGYSVIMKRDIVSKVTTQLSFRSRWFSPDISPDGKVIVATENSPANENALLLMDTRSGELIKKVPAPGNILPVAPKWSDDMSEIVFISYSEEGEGIMSYNPDNDLWTTHIPQSNMDLESVRIRGDTIFYVSSASGTENIYSIDNQNNIKQIGSSKFGTVNISLDGGDIIFSDYTSDGYNIGSLPITESSMEVVDNEFVKPFLINDIDSDKKLVFNESDYLAGSYSIEKYRKGLHLFNIHSWMPFYADIEEFSYDHLPVSAGLTVMSQNHLSTLTSTLGYEYTGGEHLLHSRIRYEGLLPAFDFDLTYGGAPAVLQDNDVTSNPSVLYTGFKATSSVYLPFYFQSGRFNQTIWPSYKLSYSNNYIFDEETSTYDYGQTIGTARFYFSNFQKRSYRDIWPRLGQVFEYYFTHSPTDADLYGIAHTLRSTLYFPGIFRNNSIRLRYQAEKQTFEKYLYYNKVSYPRGYKHIISADIKLYSVDYSFPVAYPDVNLGSIIYLSRIRSVLFYDHASGKENYYLTGRELRDGPEQFISAGAELMADFTMLRIPFGLSAGLQAAWLPIKKKPYFNLLFNIDVFGFVIGKDRHPF